jgi:hypothetical protein
LPHQATDWLTDRLMPVRRGDFVINIFDHFPEVAQAFGLLAMFHVVAQASGLQAVSEVAQASGLHSAFNPED